MTHATKNTRAKQDWAKKKQERNDYIRSTKFLKTVLSKDTFAEKVEAIRAVNPYFYLLTPTPTQKREEELCR